MATAITAAMVKELRERTGSGMMACKNALKKTGGDIEGSIKLLRELGQAKAVKRAGKTAAEGMISIETSSDQKQAFMVEVNSETDFVARDNNFREFAELISGLGLEATVAEVEALLGLDHEGETIEHKRQSLVAKIGENVQVRRTAYLASDGVVGAYKHGDRIGVIVALDQADAQLAKDIAMHIAATNPLAIDESGVPAELIAAEKEIYRKQALESGKPEAIVEKMVDGRIKKYFKENTLLSQPFIKNPEQTIAELLTPAKAKVTGFVRFEVGEGIVKETVDFAQEVQAQVQGSE
ncbi:MAG: translation elongation factor Ts [Gammaproteobacteria bacterium]|nr:translation elongation factor Ts [Gammaproteobacteria bacterium]